MSNTAIHPTTRRTSSMLKTPKAKRIIVAVIVVVVLVLMGLGTKVIANGAGSAAAKGEFSAATYGKTEFPKVQKAVEKRAVDASTLAEAIAADASAAGKKYGVPGTTGPELSVKFTGTVSGPAADGVYPVKVAGLPTTLQIRVQTGPAINGTDLRDATGNIKFGQFTNQIDYQNAGAALNNQMKKSVLDKVNTTSLQGKTVDVVGAFQLINPNGWLVTPVKLSVQ